MRWRKRKPFVTYRTSHYLRDITWKLHLSRGICPKCVAKDSEPRVEVPVSLVEAAWSLQNAVMAINRDEGRDEDGSIILDRCTIIDLDSIRVNLVYALKGQESHNKWPPFPPGVDA